MPRTNKKGVSFNGTPFFLPKSKQSKTNIMKCSCFKGTKNKAFMFFLKKINKKTIYLLV